VKLPQSPSGYPWNSQDVRKKQWFFVNAYNLQTKELEQFDNHDLSPIKVRAAISFPFIYPPQEIDGTPYCEGADIDPVNFPGLLSVFERQSVKKRHVYLCDILGSLEKDIVCSPRDLWEAFGLSLVVPVVSLAKKNVEIFKKDHPKELVGEFCFKIPPSRRGRSLEWSYANTCAMWDAGWKAGQEFLDEYGDDLPDYISR
jgi:predicted acylesterase/phospholipase RssA